MADSIERGLVELGLEEKEAKVYRTILELGPSPVQMVAQRAGIPRATTYVLLGSLRKRGLVTTFERGKKMFYVAESPEQLAQLVTSRADEVRRQEQLVNRLIPSLKARGQFAGAHRPTIRFYEGPEALRSLIRDILPKGAKEAIGVFSYDDAENLLKKAGLNWDDLVARRRRVSIKRRSIYTWRENPPSPDRVKKASVYIPYAELPCTADFTVAGDRVAIIPYGDPVRAVLIEDAAIASGLRSIFDSLWERAQKKE